MANPAPHPQLANAAVKVAHMSLLMQSYGEWQNKHIKFIFTTNKMLSGRIDKPSYFPTNANEFMKYWNDILKWQKREVLLYFAKTTNSSVSKQSYELLKKAYDKWPKDHYALFYGDQFAWTCNMFVGEALYLSGMNLVTGEGKYHLAKQIYDGFGRFEVIKKRDKNDKLLISTGDIVCFGSGHVEIVTSVHENRFSDDDFCSRGAGRESDQGKERCESFWIGGREIDNDDIRFVRVI